MPRHAFLPFTLFAIIWIARIFHMGPNLSLLLLGAAWFNVLAHELGHVAVLKFTGGRVRAVIPTPFMGITLHDPDYRRNPVALALAGPLAGARWVPRRRPWP